MGSVTDEFYKEAEKIVGKGKKMLMYNECKYEESVKMALKLSNQTNVVERPNGSSCSIDCLSAWEAGQIKKIRIMTICGANRRYGRNLCLKTTCFSIAVVFTSETGFF